MAAARRRGTCLAPLGGRRSRRRCSVALVLLPAVAAAQRPFSEDFACEACDWNDGQVLLDRQLSPGSAYGIVGHLWAAGLEDEVAEKVSFDYFVDGEASPSISMTLAMACGQAFPLYNGSFSEAGAPSSHGLFDAGGRMGQAGAAAGGWYHNHRVLYRTTIRIVIRTLVPGLHFRALVRGHDVPSSSPAARGLLMSSGFVVPPEAKLELMRIDNVSFDALSFVPLFSLPAGRAGILYLVTFAVDTSPSQNDYIEGCWHLATDASNTTQGIVVGTGVEDFFDSAYWFCALSGQPPCLFAHATSGLLHFSRSWANGSAISPEAQRKWRPGLAGTRERLSAYRFFDNEVVGFANGGSLRWRVGDTEGKCTGGGKALGQPSSVRLRSYVWAYTWPLTASAAPAPGQEALAV